ncbi:MAG: hypothetical protein IJ862_00065 [Selenomonadaceae bacterium]|nr:hypothetical protein [Selenomonadaceae bacterium]
MAVTYDINLNALNSSDFTNIDASNPADTVVSGGATNDSILSIGAGIIINAGGGNDVINHESGSLSRLNGQNGDDTIISSAVRLTINGDVGNDLIIATGAEVYINGGDDNDTIYTGENNTVEPGSGKDLIFYHSSGKGLLVENYSRYGNDILKVVGASEISSIEANGSDLLVHVGSNQVTLSGAVGRTVHLSLNSGDSINSSDTEDITTSDGNDTIVSSGANSKIDAGNGSNYLTISGKSSSVSSGEGVDHINVSAADVTVSPGAGNDFVTLGSANNLYQYTSGDDIINNYQNSDTISVNDNNFNLLDNLTSNNFDSRISVSEEDVTFSFGNSDEIVFKGAKGKTINFAKDSGGSYMTGFVVEGSQNSDITKISYISAAGNFSGSSENNYFIINADKVNLSPGGGNDTIQINHTADDIGSTINYSEGEDQVLGFKSIDRIKLSDRSSVAPTLGASLSGSNLYVIDGADLNSVQLADVKDETVNVLRGSDTVLKAHNSVVSLTGSTGISDVFYYTKGAGNQVITNYDDLAASNSDKIIVSTDVAVSAAAINSNNVVLTIGSNTLTINNGKGKAINIEGYGAQVYGDTRLDVDNTSGDTINTALNASVITVDASGRTSDVNITGNAKNNVMVGAVKGAGNAEVHNTMHGGTGNDTLTGGNFSDVFVYSAGKDIITNYTGWAKWDTVSDSSTNASIDAIMLKGVSIDTYSVSGQDVTFKIDNNNTLTVKNARNKHIKFVYESDTNVKASDNIYRAQTDLVITNDDVASLYATYKDTDTSVVKVGGKYIPTVTAADTKVTLIDANLEYDSSVSLYLVGNSVADSIIANKKNNDTLYGGSSKADTLIGNAETVSSGGKNYFMYQSSDGNDVIVNYHDSEGDMIYFLNTDTTIASSSLATKTGDVSFTITNSKGKSSSTLKVIGGQDKRITFANSSDTTLVSQVFGNTELNITNDDLSTVNTTINGNVKTITMTTARTSAVYIIGNSKANYITAGEKAAATLQGGTGNDTLQGSKTQINEFAFNKKDGTNRIVDFKFGTDAIRVLSGALSSTATIKNSQDMTFTIGSTKVRLEKAKGQKVSVIDSNGLRSTQVYGEKSITVTNADLDDGATLNTAANSLVVTIDAAVSGNVLSNSAYITGNKKGNYIIAGSGNESILTAAGKDTVKVSGIYNNQKLLVTDYVAGTDKIQLANGVSIAAAGTVAAGTQFGVNANDTLAADAVILTLQGGSSDKSTLAVQGTIKTSKKGVKSYGKISIVDDTKGITYAQAFGGSSIAVANGDGDTVDVRGNNNVTTINAKSRSKKAYIIANDTQVNSIYGGTKNDTIVAGSQGGSLFGAAGADLLISTSDAAVTLDGGAGADTIKAGYGANKLTGGKGNDVFFYDLKKADANQDIITDMGTGSNTLYLETGTSLTAVTTSGSSDIDITLKGGAYTKKVKLQGAVNKKITIFNAADKSSTKQVLAADLLTVVNSDGGTIDASTDYNKGVKTINAKKRTKAVYLIGNSLNNTLTSGSKNDTIVASTGQNSITGGKGSDLFIVGAGNDTIKDYTLAKNNTDTIKLAEGSLTTYSVDNKDVILKLSNNKTVTVVNGKDKKLIIANSAGQTIDTTANQLTQDGTFNNYEEYILTKKNSNTQAISGTKSLDSRVKIINATNNTLPITIVANNLDSTIKGSAKADSISGGSGNDLITTAKGKDTIVVSAGDDTITDYKAGTDVINLNGLDLTKAAVEGSSNLKLTTTKGTMTILNAIKKGTAQKITIAYGSGANAATTSQVYGSNVTALTVAAADGAVVDLSRSVNSSVQTVNATKRTAATPIKIIGNSNKNSLKGGAGADTLIVGSGGGTLSGGKGNDTYDLSATHAATTIEYTAGSDVVTGFKKGDLLSWASGVTATAAKDSATKYTITLKKGGSKLGSLSITGDTAAFDTSAAPESTTKKGVTTTKYYVTIGGQKMVYNTTTEAATTKSFTERISTDALFEDNNYTTNANANDLSEITKSESNLSTSLNYNLAEELVIKPDITLLTTNKQTDK